MADETNPQEQPKAPEAAASEPAAAEAPAPETATPASAPRQEGARPAAPRGGGGRSGGGRPGGGRPGGGGGRGGPGGGPGGPRRGKRQFFRKRKVCRFCVDRVDYIDYKNVDMLKPFVQERGKVLPRRISGTCSRHQRWLGEAIKRARNIALLPFASGY